MAAHPSSQSNSSPTPLDLLKKQTHLLQEIRDELYRKKRVEERTLLKKHIIMGVKYGLMLFGVLYFAYSIHMALEGIRNMLPRVPAISVPSIDPGAWGQSVQDAVSNTFE